MEPTDLKLSGEQATDLAIMLNITLRERSLRPAYWLRLNDVFRQLCGRNHERFNEMALLAKQENIDG